MTAATAHKPSFAPHVRRIGGVSHLDLIVRGARCGGCLAKIERGLSELPGVRQARMNLSTSRLHVAWDGLPAKADQIAGTLESLGFESGPVQQSTTEDSSESRHLLLCMGVSAFGLMNVMMLSIAVWSGGLDMTPATRNLLHMISAAIAVPVAAYSGRPFFKSAWRALRARQANMDVPISLAIILACGLSIVETALGNEHAFFDAALMLIFLLLVGRFLDTRLRAKTGQAAQELAALKNIDAHKLSESGKITIVSGDDLKTGDQLIIPMGAHIPVDAKILDGEAIIDASIVTGEADPISVSSGDIVYSGCLNLGNPLTVEVIRSSDDSFLSEIANLVEAGQQSQAKYVKLADRAAKAYVPIVHSLALLTLIGWLMAGGSPRTAILNAIAVLIITCPCALGLAVPAVQVVAVGKLFKAGIFVKTGDTLERLAEVTQVVFDKTGTLTRTGQTDNLQTIDPEDLQLFAALASQSTHPITAHLRQIESQYSVSDVIEIPGEGISGFIEGCEVRLGKKSFVTHLPCDTSEGLWGSIEGHFTLELTPKDVPRPEVPSLLTQLSKSGLPSHLVSGDASGRVENLAQALSFSSVQAQVKPTEKSQLINHFQSMGEKVLMVGDGINDAPALSHAHASVAMATGTDISRAASDIVLQGDNLSSLPFVIKMARAAKRAVLQNFGFAAAYNILAVPLAVMGLVTPLIAAAAMSLSSIIVTLNALKLNRLKAEDIS